MSPDAPSVCATAGNYLYLDDMTRAITMREYYENFYAYYWDGFYPCSQTVLRYVYKRSNPNIYKRTLGVTKY